MSEQTHDQVLFFAIFCGLTILNESILFVKACDQVLVAATEVGALNFQEYVLDLIRFATATLALVTD